MSRLRIEGLTLSRSREFTLGPIDLSVEQGSRTAIVGPSGCGKTSVLRCVAGLERGMHGTVRLGDRAVDDGRRHVAPSDRRIGFVFQDG
ncbi:MAG: ABC transporter ATP-binding protein, partial [Planctomycetes bacterium]|nr:ABC transporter ATP-binding protein [Planctomycetota bacterium]